MMAPEQQGAMFGDTRKPRKAPEPFRVSAQEFNSGLRTCAGRTCRRPVVLWRHPGTRNLMPLEVGTAVASAREDGVMLMRPHWPTCPDAAAFRAASARRRKHAR